MNENNSISKCHNWVKVLVKSQFTSDRFCSDASRDVPVIAILIALQREQQAKNPMKKNCKKKALNRPQKKL